MLVYDRVQHICAHSHPPKRKGRPHGKINYENSKGCTGKENQREVKVKKRQTKGQTGTESQIKTDIQDRRTDGHTEGRTDGGTDGGTDRQTDRQTGKQADWQTKGWLSDSQTLCSRTPPV